MKKATLLLLLSITAQPAIAAQTVQGKIACLTKQWFEDFAKFAAADDMGSIQAYLDSNKCMQMKGGLKVTVLEYPGMLSGQWHVSFNGTKFWVQRDGIRTDD